MLILFFGVIKKETQSKKAVNDPLGMLSFSNHDDTQYTWPGFDEDLGFDWVLPESPSDITVDELMSGDTLTQDFDQYFSALEETDMYVYDL